VVLILLPTQEEFKQNVPADLTLEDQVFYLDFHPTRSLLTTSFLDGRVTTFVVLNAHIFDSFAHSWAEYFVMP
jgi:hypothetical protein